MKGLFIFLIFIFALGFVSSFSVNLTYPKKVNCLQDFNVSLKIVNSSKVYDIKIDLLSNGSRISRILDNGKYKSSRYYVLNGSKKENFTLKIDCTIGTSDVCVKLRDSSDKVFVFDNYTTNIYKKEIVKDNISGNKTENYINSSAQENESKKVVMKNESYVPANYQNKNVVSYKSKIAETINLNPKTIKTKENTNLLKRNYAKFSFGIFCVLILFIYIKKSRKNKNEFR